MSDITLTASMRSNLLSLQNTQGLMDMTQERLSTGNKVNSAIDNPSSYYTAQSLSNRANDLNALLDSMGQAVQTIQAANEGIEAITTFTEQAKAVANSAMDTADSDQVASSQEQFNDILKQLDELANDSGYKGVNLLQGDDLTVTFNETRTSTITIDGAMSDSASLGINEATTWTEESQTTTDAETALDGAKAALTTANEAVTTAEGTLATAQAATVGTDGAPNAGDTYDYATQDAKDTAIAAAQTTVDNAKDTVATKTEEVAAAQTVYDDAAEADIKNNKASILSSIEEIEGAINTLRSMASTFGNNFSIVENRQTFTDSLINVLTEGADKLTLADMNEESANMLALQTRQQLAINSLSLASQASQSVLKLF